jgi:hypothetical protein
MPSEAQVFQSATLLEALHVPSAQAQDFKLIYDVSDMIDQKIRLHITPLSQDLLSAVLPSTIAHLAENITYHTLQAFPENNYGYLELPFMEAEKLKKKLSGSILRGKKIRIEEARPRKRALGENEEGGLDEPTEESAASRKRPKRTRRDPATISGHELSPDRKVKRGWTEPKKAKMRKSAGGNSDQASSKYTDKEEVLFRTKVPPNKTKAAKGHPKKDEGNPRDILVHEFEKSTIQPSFLREEGALDIKKAVEYVDGKGWVDEAGEVVEQEPSRLRKKENKSHATERPLQTQAEAKKALLRVELEPLDGQVEPDDETSSAGSTSDSEYNLTASSSQPDASKATSGGECNIQNTPTPSVHPLEAIFKRPTKAASVDIAKPSLEVQTSFSFFEPDQENATLMPDTPFNSQELRSRELRSAAPTPDTAAPSRFNSWGSRGRNDVESEDDEEETVIQAGDATPSKTASSAENGRQGSDFAKFFWKNRGDNNRTWKRRAREAKKEKRQRENRQRSRRF